MEAMGECPRGWDDLVDRRNKLEQRIINEYGKIPKADFMALVEESREAIIAAASLQENFEIKTEKNGSFFVGYKCKCISCGWFFNFEHTQQAFPELE